MVDTELLPYGIGDDRADGIGDGDRADGGVVEYAVSITGGAAATTEANTAANTTLFLHGLAGSIEDTRPLASGVRGTRVFAHLPGHGRSTGPDPLTYRVLASAARAVADHTGARHALGVSLGAATILRILTETPDRFDRVVLFLPAVADLPRSEEAITPHHLLAAALEAKDESGVAEALLRTQPIAVRALKLARDWAAHRAAQLVADGADPYRWFPLAAALPLDDLDSLRDITAQVLVIAQEGDPAHPVTVAQRISNGLPRARLEVFDARGALWGHRRELRSLVAPFMEGVRSVTAIP